MADQNKNDIDTEIILAMADFESLSKDPLAIEKMCAIMSLHAVARAYRQESIPEESIIRPIIRKKLAYIKAADTKAQLQEILRPPKVHYRGGEIHPLGAYTIPEEELILWSRTSLYSGGPLIPPAFNRYCKLFREVFPELAKEFGI